MEQLIYKNISLWKQKDKIKEKKSISINLLFLSSIYLLDNNMGFFFIFLETIPDFELEWEGQSNEH